MIHRFSVSNVPVNEAFPLANIHTSDCNAHSVILDIDNLILRDDIYRAASMGRSVDVTCRLLTQVGRLSWLLALGQGWIIPGTVYEVAVQRR